MTWISNIVSLLVWSAIVLTVPYPLKKPITTRAALSAPHITAESLHKPSSLSTWINPSTPPGFEIELRHTSEASLNPVGVYMLSIGYLHTFQPRQWTAPVTTGQFVYPVTPWTANVVIREVNPITPAGIHLTNGNAMLGLYAAVTHISLGRFVPTVAELIWHRRAAGRIYIDTKQGSTTLDSANNSTNGFSLHVPESNSSNAGYAGQVIDPIDHTLVVSYKFYGRRIGSKDMYTSIMESLIIMTYNGRSEPFESLTATSVSGNCALHIDAFRSERPDVNNISRLVFFLALITTNHKRFDEMEFSLEKGPPGGRRRVAEGYLFRVDAGVATA